MGRLLIPLERTRAPSRPLNALALLQDHGIAVDTSGTGRKGWVNVCCPWPHNGGGRDVDFKGGFNPAGYYHCWICGGHDIRLTLSKLLGQSPRAIEKLQDLYAGGFLPTAATRPTSVVAEVVPPGEDLSEAHRRYLVKRGFDPDWLIHEYGLKGTGDGAWWKPPECPKKEKSMNFSHRLIIPVRDRFGRVVSFQGRDITGLEPKQRRYLGPKLEWVPEDYKRTLYGLDKARQDLVAVVEGVTDQWRMGRGTVGSFGTAVTDSQIRLLMGFKRVLWLFDSEPEAQAKAKKAAGLLASCGVESEIIDLELGDRDPGDLSEREAAQLRADLGLC